MDEDKTIDQLMKSLFPDANEQVCDFILWELTCFPFDTETTKKQIRELAEKVKPSEHDWVKRLQEEARRLEEYNSQAMRENCDVNDNPFESSEKINET